jgi:two-component system, cell cycle sensor histidine kinase and response regulator CckA
MVSLVLTAQGYKVLSAASGVEALKLYEQTSRPIDLLLTDMVMPGGLMGGELANRLRSANPRLKVIFTSGYSPGMAGKDISLLEDGNFLPKPYSIGKLAQFVRECLDSGSHSPCHGCLTDPQRSPQGSGFEQLRADETECLSANPRT